MTNREIYKSLCEIENQIHDLSDEVKIYTPIWFKLCKMEDELEKLENQALRESLRMKEAEHETNKNTNFSRNHGGNDDNTNTGGNQRQ